MTVAPEAAANFLIVKRLIVRRRISSPAAGSDSASSAAGAAGIVLHASVPREMHTLLEAYTAVRPAARFTDRSPVPGR